MISANKLGKNIQDPRKSIRKFNHAVMSKFDSAHRRAMLPINSRRPVGTQIFDQDWDLLVILDSCRPGLIKEVKDEYEFVNGVDRVWSVGGTSPEWMAHTFERKYIQQISQTGYVTSNPHSQTVIENQLQEHFADSSKDVTALQRYKHHFDIIRPGDLGHYQPVWKKSSKDEVTHYDLYGSPRKVTEHGIRLGRHTDLDQLILHYMPPHIPYIINAKREDRSPYRYEESPWGYIRETGDKMQVREVAVDMVRWVLDEVEIVLDNIDADRVVITADHGDAFGEYYLYHHWAGSFHPNIRYVPWIETTASDNENYEPNISDGSDEVEIEQRLEALGYL